MKGIILVLMGLIMIPLALSASNTYPTNHNLFNPEHFTVIDGGNTIENVGYFEVEPSTAYTIMFGGSPFFSGVNVYIEGAVNGVYLDGSNLDSNICQYAPDVPEFSHLDKVHYYCTVNTSIDETGLRMRFEKDGIGSTVDIHPGYPYYMWQIVESPVPLDYLQYSGTLTPPVEEPVYSPDVILNYAWNESVNIDTIIDRHIKAIDNVDGDVSNRIQVTNDEYSSKEAIVGEYLVNLSVTDFSQNEATLSMQINVVDERPPRYQGEYELFIPIQEALNDEEAQILVYSTFYDDYDQDNVNFTLLDSNYNAEAIGSYEVSFQLEDQSGNTDRFQIMMHVINEEVPVIEGPNTITLYLSKTYTLEDVLVDFNAYNAFTLETVHVTVKSHNLPEDFATVGTYQVTISAIDESENEATKTVTVRIEDDIPPQFYFDDVLITELGTILTQQSIYNHIKNTYAKDGVTIQSMVLIEDDYTNNATKEGLYPYKVNLLSDTGDNFNHQLNIAVNEAEIIEEASENFPYIYALIGLSLVGLLITIKRKGS